MKINISIIIPVYRAVNTLRKSLNSINNQNIDLEKKIEIILVIDDGKKYNLFGEGGVKKTADEFNKEFLGEIPINPDVGKSGDNGKPIVEENPDNEISRIYLDFAKKIKLTYL